MFLPLTFNAHNRCKEAAYGMHTCAVPKAIHARRRRASDSAAATCNLGSAESLNHPRVLEIARAEIVEFAEIQYSAYAACQLADGRGL